MADLAQHVEKFRQNGHRGSMKAFDYLLDLDVQSSYFKTVFKMIELIKKV